MQLIAQGRTAEVFLWGTDRVLKLYGNTMPVAMIDFEFQLMRALHQAGLPVPDVYELLEVENRKGILFERLQGVSMLQAISAHPDQMFVAARQLAELHFKIHRSRLPPFSLPSQKQQMLEWIRASSNISEQEKNQWVNCFNRLAEGNALCHGDFHPDNIILTEKGPMIIDWITCTRGNQIGDVARTCVLFQTASMPKHTSVQFQALFEQLKFKLEAEYLKEYFSLCPGFEHELMSWMPAANAAVNAWRSRFSR